MTPGRRAVTGVAGVLLAVAAVLGVRLAMATAAARPAAVGSVAGDSSGRALPTGTGGSTSPASGLTGASTGASSGASTGQEAGTAGSLGATGPPITPTGGPSGSLLVHVAGRVRHPGVVRLPAGARVQDALRAAGGALAGSDLVDINLAQVLTDGEQVRVERAGRGSSVSTGAAAPSGPAGAASSGSVMVSLNSGDVTALDALPGVGPVLAQRIVDWRTEHGRFSSVDELDEVSGIGDKLLSEIRPHVRL